MKPSQKDKEAATLKTIEETKVLHLDSEILTLFEGRMHILNERLKKYNGILDVRHTASHRAKVSQSLKNTIKAIFDGVEVKKLAVSHTVKVELIDCIFKSAAKIEIYKIEDCYSDAYNTGLLYMPLKNTRLFLCLNDYYMLHDILSNCVFSDIKVYHLTIRMRKNESSFNRQQWNEKFIAILSKLEIQSLHIFFEDATFLFNILLKLEDSWIQRLEVLNVEEKSRHLHIWTTQDFNRFKDELFKKGFKGHFKITDSESIARRHLVEPRHTTDLIVNSGNFKALTVISGYHQNNILQLATHLNQNTSVTLKELHVWIDLWPFDFCDTTEELEDLIVQLIKSERFKRLSIGSLILTQKQTDRIYGALKDSTRMISFAHTQKRSHPESLRREQNLKLVGTSACLLLTIRKFRKTWMSSCSKDIAIELAKQLLVSFCQP